MDKVNALDVNRQTLPKTKLVKGFTQISNAVLLDQRLSFKARGILSLLLSRPDDWQIYINEITSKSERDGKRAVQSGFKELVEFGYLKLLPVYNDDTGRFEGTYYHLSESIFLPRQAHFRTVEKEDSPKSRSSEIQTAPNTDHLETASLSKTESSNTNNSNKKQQQQQKLENPIDDGVQKINQKNITAFIDELTNDEAWQQQFIGQQPGSARLITVSDFAMLLLHFKQTSLKSGNIYSDIAAAKRHFNNWFNVNAKKQALPAFIEAQHKAAKKAKSEVSKLIPKTDELIDKLLQRQCTQEQQVISLQERLLAHQGLYRRKLDYLLLPAEQTTVHTVISDIKKLSDKIDKATSLNQLKWFCQQTK